MAKSNHFICTFKMPNLRSIVGNGYAMSPDPWDSALHSANPASTVMTHGVNMPVFWESPPISPQMNR